MALVLKPGGGIKRLTLESGEKVVLVYEPLGRGDYVISLGGERSLVAADSQQAIDLGPGVGKAEFEGLPLTKPLWHVPSRLKAEAWADGSLKVRTNAELYDRTRKYYAIFGDFAQAWHPDILSLFVFQSYLKPLLGTLFQVPISGEFGSGKTAVLEALAAPAYHPIMAATCSPAARARLTQGYEPTWFIDEADKVKQDTEGDSYDYVLMRTGYRRNNLYIRWDSEAKGPDVSEPFAALAYSMSSSVEKALQTRALGEVEVEISDDSRIPVINSLKEGYGYELNEELLFWRLDFMERRFSKSEDSQEPVPDLTELIGLPIDEARERLYDIQTRGMNQREKAILKRLFGREAELSFIALKVESLLGIDVIESLARAVNVKRMAEASESDPRFTWLVNHLQVLTPLNQSSTLDSPGAKGPPKVRMNEVAQTLKEECQKNSWKEPGGRSWSSWYHRLGIEKGVNYRRDVEGTYILLTPAVRKAIDRILNAQEIDVEALRELGTVKAAVPGSEG